MRHRCLAYAFAMVCVVSQSMAEEGQGEGDIQALNDAMEMLLGAGPETDTGGLFEQPELEIALSVTGGIWTVDGVPLEDHRLILPVDTVVLIKPSSGDLIYEMAFPDLQLEFTAIPGRFDAVFIEFSQTGLFAGECVFGCGSAGAPLVFDVRDMASSE